MAEQMQLSLLGLAGLIGTIVLDRKATVQEVKDAMIHQCQLPSWQYKLVDGETELLSMESLTISDPEPGTKMHTAKAKSICRIGSC